MMSFYCASQCHTVHYAVFRKKTLAVSSYIQEICHSYVFGLNEYLIFTLLESSNP